VERVIVAFAENSTTVPAQRLAGRVVLPRLNHRQNLGSHPAFRNAGRAPEKRRQLTAGRRSPNAELATYSGSSILLIHSGTLMLLVQ
jgi:hypothetical protein